MGGITGVGGIKRQWAGLMPALCKGSITGNASAAATAAVAKPFPDCHPTRWGGRSAGACQRSRGGINAMVPFTTALMWIRKSKDLLSGSVMDTPSKPRGADARNDRRRDDIRPAFSSAAGRCYAQRERLVYESAERRPQCFSITIGRGHQPSCVSAAMSGP